MDEVVKNLENITSAIEKGIITQTLVDRAGELEEKRYEIQKTLNDMHCFIPLKYEDFSPVIDEFKGLKRNTESFRTFIQYYIEKVTVYPYHLEITLNTGLGTADELNETVTIRRGELYALFESKVKE